MLQSFDSDRLPSVIFVTAHDKYAVQPFDVHAMDYLLKPFSRKRFAGALDRVPRQRHSKSNDSRVCLLKWLRETAALTQNPDRLVIKSANRICILETTRIEWIEAHGDYIKLHLGKDTHLAGETMQAIQSQLNPHKFVRICRSAIVNLDFVRELHPMWGGDYRILLHTGVELTWSRSYRKKLQACLVNADGRNLT